MYKTQRYQAEIPVKEYLERYVDVETFLESCRACPNYGKLWSCPACIRIYARAGQICHMQYKICLWRNRE